MRDAYVSIFLKVMNDMFFKVKKNNNSLYYNYSFITNISTNNFPCKCPHILKKFT